MCERGKRFVAANPWPLAAEAKRLGLPTDGFQESDFVPDDKVYIIDLDALAAIPGERQEPPVCPKCGERHYRRTKPLGMRTANRLPTPNQQKGGDTTLPTQIVPQISQQLARAYETTQRELNRDQEMSSQVWDEALTKLQGFDPSDPSFPQFIDAHASVSILEQVLTSVSGRAGFLNGNQTDR